MHDAALFTPADLAGLFLPNRVLMTPLTHFRAAKRHTPTPVMAACYARLAAGTLLADPEPATFYTPGPQGYTGYPSLK